MKTAIILLALVALPCLVVSADVTGTWKSEFDSQIGVQKYTYTFKQDGTNLTGKASSEVNDQKREAKLISMMQASQLDVPVNRAGIVSLPMAGVDSGADLPITLTN